MDIYRFLSALLLLVIQTQPSRGQDTCDQCDCRFSSIDDDRAVYSIKSRCTSGAVDWDTAYGALQLQIQPIVRSDYRLCFDVDSHHTVAKVSREAPRVRTWAGNFRRNRKPEVKDPRLSLTPLLTTRGRSREVCVTGRTKQPVVLYVEVERSSQFTGLPSLKLRYDVETLTDAALADPMEECRPCTQEELLEAYCTSDFVAVGGIHRTQSDHSTDHMHIEVAAKQLVHQNSQVFRRLRRDDRHLFGTIVAPAKCGIHHGSGDFLFLGRMRLGKAKLRCAPYYKDWLRISSMAECVYD